MARESKIKNEWLGLNFLEALFLLFLGLKLGNVISWSWWWVFAPLWVPVVVVVAAFGIVAIVVLVQSIIKRKGVENGSQKVEKRN